MARIPLALAAAAAVAATLGSNLALAQSGPAYTPSVPPSSSSMPMQQAPMSPGMARPGMMPRAGAPAAPSSGMPMSSSPTSSAPTTMSQGGPVVQTPSQPFSDLNLPRQGVGNGAYNGGGVVLEYLPDGTRRVVQQ